MKPIKGIMHKENHRVYIKNEEDDFKVRSFSESGAKEMFCMYYHKKYFEENEDKYPGGDRDSPFNGLDKAWLKYRETIEFEWRTKKK